MRNLLSAAAVIVALAAGAAFAKDGQAPFLPTDAIDLAAILPPPPTQDGAITKAEIAEIHRAGSAATPSEKDDAVADTKEEVFLFANIMGPMFTPDRLPLATKLFQLVGETEGEFVGPAKKAFGRPRPPLADPTIIPCEKLRPSGAYPSGHATFGYLEAIVLTQIVPEKREAIFQRAAEFGQHRVVCGVHYPSDIEAGKVSAFAIGAALLKNSSFQEQLTPARAEVRRVLGLSAQ
ncbi:MAG: rane-associated phospholipid phosphatase [Rhodospirillales bacterium]|nr:rane-associated phospholipid phosphatase [Rhodospirillales bacterium]